MNAEDRGETTCSSQPNAVLLLISILVIPLSGDSFAQSLEDLFETKVDLILTDTIKPRLRSEILKEAIYGP